MHQVWHNQASFIVMLMAMNHERACSMETLVKVVSSSAGPADPAVEGGERLPGQQSTPSAVHQKLLLIFGGRHAAQAGSHLPRASA
jgi:hypothetical protein